MNYIVIVQIYFKAFILETLSRELAKVDVKDFRGRGQRTGLMCYVYELPEGGGIPTTGNLLNFIPSEITFISAMNGPH